jgi:predicted HicB family RNase H-like nuclease
MKRSKKKIPLMVRLPEWLHRSIVRGAERNGVSMNQHIIDCICLYYSKEGKEHREFLKSFNAFV